MSKRLSTTDVAKILVENGYRQHHKRGDHFVFIRGATRVHVPYRNEIQPGTLCMIFKKAGLKHIYKELIGGN